MPDFTLDPTTLDYRQVTGKHRRRVSAASMAALVVRFSMGVRDEMRANAKALVDGKIDAQEWYNEQARLMKLSYHATISSARGRQADDGMSDEEKALLLFLLWLLFQRLNKTAEGIISGRIVLDGRFVNRMGMYGMASKGVWENWRLWMAKKAGYTEARRVLGIAEHCRDEHDPLGETVSHGCVELADLGWIPIGDVVPIGQATCLSNCKCRIIYRGLKPSAGLSFTTPTIQNATQKINLFRDVRDRSGRLLFRYDPSSRRVEIKHKGMDKAQIVELKEYHREN